MRLPFPFNAGEGRVPPDVFIELVSLMYTALTPIVIMGFSAVGIGCLVAASTGDVTVVILTAAAMLITLGRIVGVLAYRKGVHAAPLTEELAKAWERKYAIGSILFAVALGALSVRVLIMPSSAIHMLVTGLIFGYGSGLVTRVAVRPRICTVSLLTAAVPTALAMAVHVVLNTHDDLAYGGQAALIAVFAIGSLGTAHHSYRITLHQLLTKRTYASLARQDALTGLPNRILLRERFEEDLTLIRRGGALLALHFLDLDRFKAVNDSFGHPVGDALLVAVAERLTGMLRASDTAGRVGGDEFVIVQTGVSHQDEARMLAHRIIRTISAPYEIQGHLLTIGTSVGIAMAPQDGVDMEALAVCADAALYQAKNRGRGGVTFWSELPQAIAHMAA